MFILLILKNQFIILIHYLSTIFYKNMDDKDLLK